MPKSRQEFWGPKLEANRCRDLRNEAELREAGWQPFVVWECEIRDLKRLRLRVAEFLGGPNEVC